MPKIDSRGVASNASDPDPEPVAPDGAPDVVDAQPEEQPEPDPVPALPRRTRRAAPKEA